MITLYEGIDIRITAGHPNGAAFTSPPYPLLDAIDCIVTEERNGQFSLVMRYPIGAQYADKIVPDAIIMATPRPNACEEPFRIYEIEQVIDGVVTARANHLVYDLDGLSVGLPDADYRWGNAQGITNVLNVLDSAGQFITRCFKIANDGIVDTTTTVDFGGAKSVTIWKAIGTICAAFGAEMKYTWDSATNNCTITFCSARGAAKPAIISYGVNLISLDRKLDYSGLYSRVVCVWFGANYYRQGYADTGYTGRERSLWIDVTDEYSSEPSTATLDARAQAYVDSHDWNPSSDLSVEFVPFENTTEYDDTPVSKLTDSTPYVSRTSGGSLTLGVRNRENDKVIGGTIAWNQLCPATKATQTLGDVTVTNNGDGTFTLNGTYSLSSSSRFQFGTPAIDSTHKYLVRGISGGSSTKGYFCVTNSGGLRQPYVYDDGIFKFSADGNQFSFRITTKNTVYDNFVVTTQIFDLTAMFGSTIADYLYTLESDTPGSGVAWLTSHGFFTADYYTRQTEKIESVQTSAHIMWDGSNNVIGNYALDPDLVLRGILKLDASNNLYYDGDEYSSDGTVIRKYAERAYTSGDATDGSTMITDGTTTVYKLGVSTTETADPFTNPQNVEAGGIEQYVDAGLANNTRTFSMPVGHETTYFYVSGVSGLELCDTATVDASIIGVTATAKCVKVVYNVLTKMYDTVTVGTLQNDIVDTILKLG